MNQTFFDGQKPIENRKNELKAMREKISAHNFQFGDKNAKMEKSINTTDYTKQTCEPNVNKLNRNKIMSVNFGTSQDYRTQTSEAHSAGKHSDGPLTREQINLLSRRQFSYGTDKS
jgi:hypothetical protein